MQANVNVYSITEMILGFQKMGPRAPPPPKFSEGATCNTEGATFIILFYFISYLLLIIHLFSHNFMVNVPLWRVDFEKKRQHLKKLWDWCAPAP